MRYIYFYRLTIKRYGYMSLKNILLAVSNYHQHQITIVLHSYIPIVLHSYIAHVFIHDNNNCTAFIHKVHKFAFVVIKIKISSNSNISQFKSWCIIHPITSHCNHFTIFFEQSNDLLHSYIKFTSLLVFWFCPGEEKAALLS
jgi:K+-transporting ATPase A subunit